MERAAPLPLRSKFALAAGLFLAACARSAPDLPPDYSSVNTGAKPSLENFDHADVGATCADIAAERDRTRSDYAALERRITSTRRGDQAAGYVSAVLFPPAALAIDQKGDEKRRLDDMQARLDELAMLSRLKTCGAAVPTSAESLQQ